VGIGAAATAAAAEATAAGVAATGADDGAVELVDDPQADNAAHTSTVGSNRMSVICVLLH
jgi:hypothetical protein